MVQEYATLILLLARDKGAIKSIQGIEWRLFDYYRFSVYFFHQITQPSSQPPLLQAVNVYYLWIF
jgi:hypothetical protein